jgi:hypothetical protein
MARQRVKKNIGKVLGFRSGLEETISEQLAQSKVEWAYEEHKIKYLVPAKSHTYTPDFVLGNGIVIETKGRFVMADRAKHLLIKAQFPDLDIRFIFSNSRAKLYKGAKSSYGDWCDKHGFKYADKIIPEGWLKETT